VYPSINCERCGTDCTGQTFFAMTHVEPYETWCNTCYGAHHGLEDDDEEGEDVDEEGKEGKE
jgi:transcription elongation factor Elf1